MKLLAAIIPFLFGLSSTDIIRTVLPVEVLPLHTIATTDAPVWDLSATVTEFDGDEEIAGCSYIIYGDTLISETIMGVRRWYSIEPEGCGFIREESLTHSCVPTEPLPTSVFPSACTSPSAKAYSMSGVESGYSAEGISMREFSLGREGTYRSLPAVKGLLIISDRDTVAAQMTTEEFRYSETVSPIMPGSHSKSNSEAGKRDTSGHDDGVVVRIHRWFMLNNGILPIAVQTEVDPASDGNTALTISHMAFRADDTSLAQMTGSYPGNPGQSMAPAILKDADISVNGGRISIVTSNTEPIRISVAVSSEGGIPYFMDECSVCSTLPVEIDCASFPPGRYVIALSCGDTIEKRLVGIN